MEVFYIENSNLVELRELRDNSDDSIINDATVEVTVYDRDGVEVTGQAWPKALLYVPDSEGLYQGTLDEAMDLEENDVYTAKITVIKNSDRGVWHLPVRAKKRIA